MPSILPPAPIEQASAARWTTEGTSFLRRVMAGEVYTGLSGEALALWAVGIHDKPRDRPWDRSDFRRCMNVYWSAPESLRPKMREQLETWAERLANQAGHVEGWRWEPADFRTPRQYEPDRHRAVRL